LIQQIVCGTAAAYGAQAEVELIDDYPALTNNASVTRMMEEEARRLLGNENVIIGDAPSMGADDFAYFTNAAKGCYFNIGTATPGKPLQSLHSEFFAPDEGCVLTGLALLSAGAWRLMEEGQ